MVEGRLYRMRLLLARHPQRLEAKHPLLIEELLELVEGGRQEAVDAIIAMLEDLYLHGRESRYFRTLKGLPLCELKAASRGGVRGGSRVYFFLNDRDEAIIVNCEVKAGEAGSAQKLKTAAVVAVAYGEGWQVVRDESEQG